MKYIQKYVLHRYKSNQENVTRRIYSNVLQILHQKNIFKQENVTRRIYSNVLQILKTRVD